MDSFCNGSRSGLIICNYVYVNNDIFSTSRKVRTILILVCLHHALKNNSILLLRRRAMMFLSRYGVLKVSSTGAAGRAKKY